MRLEKFLVGLGLFWVMVFSIVAVRSCTDDHKKAEAELIR